MSSQLPNRRTALRALAAVGPLAVTGLAAADPWTAADLIEPEVLARRIRIPHSVAIFYVGFAMMYQSAHIPGATYAGPGSKPAGLALLRRELAALPKDREIVLYCGCCPWNDCPNVRPAWQLVKSLGYRKARLVKIATNLHTDWVMKGYPIERPVSA